MDLSLLNLSVIVALGLIAGIMGGMLGVGGSIIMIPGLTFIFDRQQHLFQAAVMIANVAVSVPAAVRHRKSGQMNRPVLKWMLPVAVLFVLLGVWLSNRAAFQRGGPGAYDGELWLGRILAGFLFYVAVRNLVTYLRPAPAVEVEPIATPARSSGVGAAMGTVAGLLGIGGGAVAVPLQQMLIRLPLRSCIANSSMVICISAAIGAVYKNATLGGHHYAWTDSLLLAAILGPTCVVGGYIGAALTHRLPGRHVRLAFIGLMFLASWKMSALPWPLSS